ncbi:hypothetical protein H0H87_003654 [Tephrocybe sp. NHM501043]|nr:hypothetical protein H0H87_003654 [Tephrocybe sp. NHM501043]
MDFPMTSGYILIIQITSGRSRILRTLKGFDVNLIAGRTIGLIKSDQTERIQSTLKLAVWDISHLLKVKNPALDESHPLVAQTVYDISPQLSN